MARDKHGTQRRAQRSTHRSTKESTTEHNKVEIDDKSWYTSASQTSRALHRRSHRGLFPCCTLCSPSVVARFSSPQHLSSSIVPPLTRYPYPSLPIYVTHSSHSRNASQLPRSPAFSFAPSSFEELTRRRARTSAGTSREDRRKGKADAP